MPFDVAFSLDEIDALAFTIAFGEIDGGEFDYGRMQWKERS